MQGCELECFSYPGEALGIATPANRVLHTLVKLLEGGRPG